MLNKIFNILLGFTLLVGVLFLTFRYGPTVERNLFPVITNTALEYSHPVRFKELIIAKGYVTKRRDCKPNGLIAQLGDQHDGTIEYFKVKIVTVGRTQLSENLEQWTMLMAVPQHYVDGDNILKLTAQYTCHRFWDLEQVIANDLIKDVMDEGK